MKVSKSKLHVKNVIVPNLFCTGHVSEPVLKETANGVHALELLITEILEQDCNQFSLKIEDVAEQIGGNAKKMRSDIKKAIRAAHDKYDGKYDPPAIVGVDKCLYALTALVIREDGRTSDDLIEYTVRTNIDEYFNPWRLDTANDFSCFVFMIDYLETCLRSGRIPITKYLRQYCSSVTSNRLVAFMKKQDWYGSSDLAGELFCLSTDSPSLSSIMNASVEVFTKLKDNIETSNFEEFVID